MKRLRTQQNYLIQNKGETENLRKIETKDYFALGKIFFWQVTDVQSNCYIKLSSSVNKGFVGAIFQFALTLTLSVTLSCFKKPAIRLFTDGWKGRE
jgi:hypothetical protein